MDLLDFKGCNDFYDQYFKKFSFLGILSNGKYKCTANVNIVLFIIIIVLYFTAFSMIFTGSFKAQCAELFILIASSLVFYGTLFWRMDYLQNRFDLNNKNNKDKRPEFDRKRDFIINYLEKKHGQVSSIVLKQYLNNLRNKISTEKLKQNVWIGAALIFLTTAIGAQYSNIDFTKPGYNDKLNLLYLFSMALIFLIYLQYTVAVGKSWKLGLYIELELTLDLFYEVFKEQEAREAQKSLIEKLNENGSKQRCAIDRFFD